LTEETYKYMDYDLKFNNLVEKRKEKGISQRKMAELLGVSESNISRWESLERRSIVAYFGYKRILGGD